MGKYTSSVYENGNLVSRNEMELNSVDARYAFHGGFRAETQSDHITAMQNALIESVAHGGCQYSQEDNGGGSIHIYTFEKGQAPTFDTNSQDVFNQIRIVENA